MIISKKNSSQILQIIIKVLLIGTNNIKPQGEKNLPQLP